MEKAAKATFSCYSCNAFFCEAASGLLLFQRIANFDFRLFTQVTHQSFKDDLCVVLGEPRQHSDALVQSQGCKIPSGCIETLSASLSRQLTVEYDYVWFVPSGAVKDDLRHATLVALPVPGHGAGEPIGILTRVDATFSSGSP